MLDLLSRSPRAVHAVGGVLLLLVAPAHAASEREVELPGAAPGDVVACTWTEPESPGPWPAAALLSVAGPDDRHQSIGPHRLFETLAHGMANSGIASLRCDDPGVGRSTGDWLAQGYDERAADALRRLAWIRQQPGVDSEHVGLVGNSEGGAAAPLAAVQAPEAVDFIVLLAGPGAPAPATFARTLEAALERLGIEGEAAENFRAKLRELVEIQGLDPAAPSTQERMREFLRGGGGQLLPPYPFVPRDLEGLADFLLSPWYRAQFAYDPEATWSRVRAPTLALGASLDPVLPPSLHLPLFERLFAERPESTARLLDGLNHVFQEARTGSPNEYALLPGSMSPRVVRLVTDFVHSSKPRPAPEPTGACDAAWRAPRATELLERVRRATSVVFPNWLGHAPADDWFVLETETAEGGSCLALLQGGALRSFFAPPEPPSFNTPLYGFFYGQPSTTARGATMDRLGAQPEAIDTWLRGQGVDRAVVVRTNPKDMPFELTPAMLTQLGLHESFHANIQMPRWRRDEAGLWPTWDAQPDRAATRTCTAATDEVQALFQQERAALTRAVEAGLDGDRAQLCRASSQFLSHRDARRQLVLDLEVPRDSGGPAGCAEAEAIWELVEGVADWASWVYLFEIGEATKERLLLRYRAQQADTFYLTGAMQLHAAQMLRGDAVGAARQIARSEGVEAGAVEAVLRSAVTAACEARTSDEP